jgi:hypothetical protein
VQAGVIQAQEEMLAALSTPLLPITDDILVLPLIGAVTAERANQVSPFTWTSDSNHLPK